MVTSDNQIPVNKLEGITYHVWRPLQQAGISTVEQLQNTPTEKLREIVSTPKSLRSLLKAIGREEEITRLFGEDTIAVDGQTLDMAPLRALVSLRGTYRFFRFQSLDEMKQALETGTRLDPDSGLPVSFSWTDIARYKLQRDALRQAAESADEDAEADAVETIANVTERVADRMAEYMKDYDTAFWTTSETKTLNWLSALEIRVEMLQQRQLMGDPASEATSKLRSEEIERTLNQIRKLRDDLQISLKNRIEAGRQKASEDIIKDLSLRGKQLLAQRASILQHCGILQGIFLPNFPAHIDTTAITVRCARCGEPLRWQLVTQRMLDLYTEAGAFVPADAPPGMFQDERTARK